MPRESLGQFRIYQFTCDACGKEERREIRGSRRARITGQEPEEEPGE